MVPLNKAGQT